MSTAVANPAFVTSEEVTLRRFLVYSLLLHGGLAALIASSIIFHFQGQRWGDIGGGSEGQLNVKLVGSVGLPMPKPPDVTESKTFDPTDSMYKTVPQPKPPEPPKPEIKIPKFKEEKPLPPTHKSRVFENPTPAPDNAVAQNGGRMNVPTGTAQVPGAAAPGVKIQGQGGADFALRYGWYIQSVRRRVNPNWDVMTIDNNVRYSTTLHCAVSFTINRDGSIKNVRIAEPSGNLSWDNAGLRAIYNSNPLPPLPSDFQGTEVDVTWDFPIQQGR